MSVRALTTAATAIAIVAPVTLAAFAAQRDANDSVRSHATALARDVLYRSELTGAQIADGIDLLVASGTAPCSPANLMLMDRIDTGSSYIQAMGYVADDHLRCSSL